MTALIRIMCTALIFFAAGCSSDDGNSNPPPVDLIPADMGMPAPDADTSTDAETPEPDAQVVSCERFPACYYHQ